MASRPRQGELLLRVSVRGAGRTARDFDRAARGTQDEIVRELRELAVRSEIIVREYMPEDSGDLKEGLHARFFFRAARPRFTLQSTARHQGYPYTAVTRFGHRKAVIEGRPFLTIHGPGVPRDGAPEHIARVVRQVRGFGFGEKQPHDWMEEAMPRVQGEMAIAASRIGRRIESRLLPGNRQS